MSSAFNPYHQWLGLANDGQALNYYRLLGVAAFESDVAIIERAAQQQLARIQSLARPEQAAVAKSLADQIIMARNILLSPASKDAYDSRLTASLPAAHSGGIHPSGAAATVAPMQAERLHHNPVPPVSPVSNPNRAHSAAPLWRQPIILLPGVLALAILTGVALMLRTAEEIDEESDTLIAQAEPSASAEARADRPEPRGMVSNDSARQSAPSERARDGSKAEPPVTARPRATSLGDDKPGESLAPDGAATPRSPPDAPTRRVENEEGDRTDEPTAEGPAAVNPSEGSQKTAPEPMPVGAVAAAPAVESKPSAPAIGAANDATSDWLKLDEEGEPCEVTLTDGTVLKLDTYGDSYQGYQPLTPADGSRAQVVLDYQTARLGGGRTVTNLRLDADAGRMYWIEIGPSSDCMIRGAPISGRGAKVLVDLRFQNARALAIDPKQRKLYWGNHAAKTAAFGAPPDARQAVWCANLDGSDPKPLFGGLTELGGIAVEPDSGRIFYFDGLRLVRGEADGTGETAVISHIALPSSPMRGYSSFTAAIDQQRSKIYWFSNDTFFARANLDGTEFEVPFDIGQSFGHVTGEGLDVPNGKVYWAEEARDEVWRTSLDGSQPEAIAVGMESASSVEVDSKRGYVYWADFRFAQGDSYALIRRLKLPRVPAAEPMPAPPLIHSIETSRESEGGKVKLHGAHLSGATDVRLIGDDAELSKVAFSVLGDTELTFTLPPPRHGEKKAAVIVQGPGGLTVTLPRDLHTIKDFHGPASAFDRFRDSDKFCFNVAPGAQFGNVEGSIVYAPAHALTYAGGRGRAVFFLKNESSIGITVAPGVVVYHEPFARVFGRAKGAGACEFVAVPAIRPSFVESLLQYEE